MAENVKKTEKIFNAFAVEISWENNARKKKVSQVKDSDKYVVSFTSRGGKGAIQNPDVFYILSVAKWLKIGRNKGIGGLN